MQKKKLDTYDWAGGKASNISPDKKHTAKFTKIGEWRMGVDWFTLGIDDYNFGEFHTVMHGWTPNSRYYVSVQFTDQGSDDSSIIVIDIKEKQKTVINWDKLMFIEHIDDTKFIAYYHAWDGQDSRWLEKHTYKIAEIANWRAF